MIKKTPQPCEIVVGAQAGSEAKGHYLTHMSGEYDVAVRTGAPNAGHTALFKGRYYPMQMLPATFMNPNCKLVIGAGALIDIDQLDKELGWLEEAFGGQSQKDRIYIDGRAGMLLKKHIEAEEAADMHNRIGSTAHGCGEALADRLMRSSDYKLFGQTEYADKWDNVRFQLSDTASMLNHWYDEGQKIVLEGTQGSALSLYHSLSYPQCTSRDTNAGNWIMEAGLSPALRYGVTLVARVYPIRVAGNSGELGDEISWCDIMTKRTKSAEELKALSDFKHLEEQYAERAAKGEIKPTMVHREMFTDHPWTEGMGKSMNETLGCMSTVTQKFRRIFKFDPIWWERAYMLNRPNKVCLQFLNYEFPEVEQCKSWEDLIKLPTWVKILEFLSTLPETLTDNLTHLGVNKNTIIDVPLEFSLANFD